jgi:VanZ family protein
MVKTLKFIFNLSVLFLIVIYLWPGSLLGFLLYDNWTQQPNLIKNPFGTTINHFLYFFYVSLLGFYIYVKNENFKKLVYGLFFLSITLEFFHLIIPNRSFQLSDLISNFFGVMVAYFVIKIYLLINKP